MRLAREQDFGPFMKMSGDGGFVFGQRAWRVDKKLAGGGPMMDLGNYIIQGACMAANGMSPTSVTAHEDPKTRPELLEKPFAGPWMFQTERDERRSQVITILLITSGPKRKTVGSPSKSMLSPIAASSEKPAGDH